MKIKTNELTGAALDWAVAKAMGEDDAPGSFLDGVVPHPDYLKFYPSTDWTQGGPIIEREGIELTRGNPLYFPKGNEKGDYYEDLWIARKTQDKLLPSVRGVYETWGDTPLIAAMRCYVASKLGDEIEIPEELK